MSNRVRKKAVLAPVAVIRRKPASSERIKIGMGYLPSLLFKLARVRERWPCEADWTPSVKKDCVGIMGYFQSSHYWPHAADRQEGNVGGLWPSLDDDKDGGVRSILQSRLVPNVSDTWVVEIVVEEGRDCA